MQKEENSNNANIQTNTLSTATPAVPSKFLVAFILSLIMSLLLSFVGWIILFIVAVIYTLCKDNPRKGMFSGIILGGLSAIILQLVFFGVLMWIFNLYTH